MAFDGEDVELVQRIAEGDPEALRELYGLYGKIVFGMAYRVLGDRQLAEDCTQDVFVALWRGARSYDAEAGASDDLALHDHAEHGDRHRPAPRGAPRRAAPRGREHWATDTAPDAAEVAAAGEQAERIAAAMAELPRPQLEAVSLAYFDDLSHAEIAERLDLPLGTVKGRIRLGLERLRELAPTYALKTEVER